MEVTFQEVRTHLDVETQRQWSAAACAGSVPCVPAEPPSMPRPSPTFADVLACARHVLWTRLPLFSLSPATPDIQNLSQPPPAPLLAALCYSA